MVAYLTVVKLPSLSVPVAGNVEFMRLAGFSDLKIYVDPPKLCELEIT
jgi:hypothetical protein